MLNNTIETLAENAMGVISKGYTKHWIDLYIVVKL